MDMTATPDPNPAHLLDSAVLRFAYARAFDIAVPDAPDQIDQQLLALLRDRGLSHDDAVRVLAAGPALAAVPKRELQPWAAKSYNDVARPLVLRELGGSSEKRATWPPRHDKFSQPWSKALLAAGLVPLKDSVIVPEKVDAVAHLRRFLEVPGASRSARDYVAWRKENDTDVSPPSLAMLTRIYGSWGQALAAAGAETPENSESAKQAEDAVAKLAATLEGHQAEAERLRERLRTSDEAATHIVAHHTELAYLIAMETHALESSRVNEYLLQEREASAKTFKKWAIAGTASLAIVPPIIEFVLTKYV
jgi:hypothetical protein